MNEHQCKPHLHFSPLDLPKGTRWECLRCGQMWKVKSRRDLFLGTRWFWWVKTRRR